MTHLPMFLLGLPAAALMLAVLLPPTWVNRNFTAVRLWVTRVAGLQVLLAVAFAAALLMRNGEPQYLGLLGGKGASPSFASIYYDGTACLAFLLVSFLGWIICRYSIRYLDGQPIQGRYYRWAAFTIGAVAMMVVSGNLLMFAVCWIATSLGLHQLLVHFSDRPEAQRAARREFTISRLGDLALLAAVLLVYWHFHTLELSELLAVIRETGARGASKDPPVFGASWLLVMAAMMKSVQVPFHTWLPQTMETPTSVSALMHAGIVNAGGYLIIRTAPLISQAPTALTSLAVLGAATACYGTVVMLTQTSVKRALAYSTIAQMGFMLLQCGVGAFSAAMLHLIAHSLYKAYAFLSSGSVLAQPAASPNRHGRVAAPVLSWAPLLGAVVVAIALYSCAMFSLGLSPSAKPGGHLLGFVFCLALVHWLRRVFETADHSVSLTGVIVAACLSFAYAASFLTVDTVISSNPLMAAPVTASWVVAIVVLLGFSALFALHRLLAGDRRPQWFAALQVHALNGFYIDSALRRFFGSVTTAAE